MELLIFFIVLVLIARAVLGSVLTSFRMRRIPQMSTDELKALFQRRSNFTCYHKAVVELKERDEDIGFTFPVFLDMALSGGVMELLGKGCLQNHFGDKVSHIDLTGRSLTADARNQLKELQERIEKVTHA